MSAGSPEGETPISTEEAAPVGPEDVHFPVVGIGASAGGLDAFMQLFGSLPAETGMAFVLVQHLDPSHESHLVGLLARATRMPVTEAKESVTVESDHVYVIPPNALLRISQGTLHLHPRAEVRGHHLPVDLFLCSLAEDLGARAIGVVLSGTGSDGTLGLKAIKAEGGIAFAQDETAQHDGMPQSAISSGSVDFVLPPDRIARELVRIGGHPYVNGRQAAQMPVEAVDEDALAVLFRLLHTSTRVDYANYKRSTVLRRIQRRLILHRLDRVGDYVSYVRDHTEELDALHQDLLIHVTRFFRDPDLFSMVDAQQRVYVKKPVPSRLSFDFTIGQMAFGDAAREMKPGRAVVSGVDIQREADRVVLARYAPAGVVVNEETEIIQFRGQTGAYLAPAPGVASLNLFKMAREGLLLDLRSALEEARRQGVPTRREGLRVLSNGERLSVNIQVTPITVAKQRCFVVVFEDVTRQQSRSPVEPAAATDRQGPHDVRESQVVQLQRELGATKEYLQSIIEQLEASNEELKAANEEIVSSNEELQSTNEELQASNEELNTVNEELLHRNEETRQLTDDLSNLLRSVHIPILMVGQDLRIHRFTPSAAEVLSLIPSDVGRSIGDIKTKLVGADLEKWIVPVLDSLLTVEHDVQNQDGHWSKIVIRPYRTQDNKIDGAVVSVLDIDALKRSEERLRKSLHEKETLLREVHHRVKNNLQTIHSLFDLQSSVTTDPAVVSVMRESKNRVYSMAAIHETLHRSADFARISILPYMQNLCSYLAGSHGVDPARISIEVQGADGSLDLERAVPFGLILNELVSNALVHAFPKKGSGRVRVEFATMPGDELAFTVQDDGVGLPQGVDPATAQTLGLRLIQALVGQLRGTLTVHSEGGTRFTVAFPA